MIPRKPNVSNFQPFDLKRYIQILIFCLLNFSISAEAINTQSSINLFVNQFNGAKVYKQPSVKSSILGKLAYGSEVKAYLEEVKDTKGTYYTKIQTNGITGYTQSNYLTTVNYQIQLLKNGIFEGYTYTNSPENFKTVYWSVIPKGNTTEELSKFDISFMKDGKSEYMVLSKELRKIGRRTESKIIQLFNIRDQDRHVYKIFNIGQIAYPIDMQCYLSDGTPIPLYLWSYANVQEKVSGNMNYYSNGAIKIWLMDFEQERLVEGDPEEASCQQVNDYQG